MMSTGRSLQLQMPCWGSGSRLGREQPACGENRTQCWALQSPLCQPCVRGSLQADIHFRALSCCQGKQPACRQVARTKALCLSLEAAGRSLPRSTVMMSCSPKGWERRALFPHFLQLLQHSGTARQSHTPNSCPSLLVSPCLSPSPRGSCPFSPPARSLQQEQRQSRLLPELY